MKKFLKWTVIILLVAIVALLGTIFSLQGKQFDAPLPDHIKASTDSAVIERGKYLVFGPAHCGNCHSPMENQARINAGEMLPLQGGFEFDLPIGKIYSPNITPDAETGIGRRTDAELARAMRYSVGHDGRAMFDFMPFQNLSDEDLTAIISFLRSQTSVKHEVPKRQMNLMGKAIVAFMLKPVGPWRDIPARMTPDTTAAYGEYLANSVANCRGCHTNRDLTTGAYVGEPFAGGFKMESPIEKGSFCVSPNLTPDAKTGIISEWTQNAFVARFRAPRRVAISEMPWELFGRMTDNDLKAIYQYLRTVKPVQQDNGPTYVKAKS